jgi:hypothetical protein
MSILTLIFLSTPISLILPQSLAGEAHSPAPVVEKCGNFLLTKRTLPADEADYGFELSFSYRKKKTHHLPGSTDPLRNEQFQYPKESICSQTAVFPRKDGTFWILAMLSEPPFDSFIRAYVYSPKKDAIIADHRGLNFYKPVKPSGDDILYAAVIPRSDLGGGRATFEGKERVCHETELPLVHRVTFKDGKFTDRLDLHETYEQFAYKALFKDPKEFEAYFNLRETEASQKIRRWVYALDSLQVPECIFATADNKRDCSDLTPEAVHCKKR